MAIACPECAADVAAGAKFCPECGARQPDRPSPAREVRKLVTIVFADVTGSTALGEQLDPETLRALMTRYFTVMRGVVERHGGTVEKFIGDAVMAVFGIPVVHEDDALRAVRAAAEIRDVLAAMNAELQGERAIAVRFRTGVNTGEVVAGDPDTGTTLVTGDAVNTAARLEQAAAPGEILLGGLTYNLVRDAVDAEPAGPIEAKGKAQLVEAWRLVSVHAGAEGHTRHLDAPMVGRDRELGIVIDTWHRAVDDRTPHLVTLVAPAGVGKSRLVREFGERIRADGGRVLVGRCLSYGDRITYWPVRELVHAAAGITEADDHGSARAKVESLVASMPDGGRVANRLAAAVGLSSDGAAQDELFWAVRRLLEHLADEQPTLVVLEDLHWAEEPLLDLVDYVIDLSAGVPLILLATARPEVVERRPSAVASREATTVLRLEPLVAEAAGALLDGLPGGTAIPSDLRARILGAADGTPLYVEEFVGMLRDDGTLVLSDGERWTARPDAASVTVPPTVKALLAARLEGLPEDERNVARRASVIGRSFEVAALGALDPARSTDLNRNLLALVRKELLRPDRAELTVGDAFRFRHVLIRDAAYDALSKAERATLHERVAGWLERAAGDRLPEVQEILAFHLGEAHRYAVELGVPPADLEGLALRAGVAYLGAARTAYAHEDVRAAFASTTRAVNLLPLSRALGDALALRFRVAPAVDEFAAREEAADRLAVVAEQLGDPGLAQQATLTRIHIDMDGDPDFDWEAGAATLAGLAPAFGARRELEWQSDALRLSGVLIASVTGDAATYLVTARAAVEVARQLGWPVVLARCQTHVIEALMAGPTPVDEGIQEIDDIVAADPSRTTRAYALPMLALLEAWRGRADVADALLSEADSIIQALGRFPPPFERSIVEVALERWGPAAEDLRVVNDYLEVHRDTWLRSVTLTLLAEARLGLGDAHGALESTQASERLLSRYDLDTRIRATTMRARALVALGEVDEGLELASAAVELAKPTDWLAQQGWTQLHLASALQSVGRRDEAVEVARGAVAAYEAKGHLTGVRRAEAIVSRRREQASHQ
jgi:class 3 adenylate cyclase/tetratricopeptide (TPR) repeat protein